MSDSVRFVVVDAVYCSENLELMRELPDDSIDLIYIDPPFCTQSSRGQYDDRWHGGITGYTEWLVERLVEMYRLLKPTGSLFVHLDYRAVHYIKVELDWIFGGGERDNGAARMVNELVWCYQGGGRGRRSFARKHDTILWYAKSDEYTFNSDDVKIPYELISPKSTSPFNLVDRDGRRHYRQLRKGGKVYTYFEDQGKIPNDWWIDIQPLQGRHGRDERCGYPTQKPVSLLTRIISATTKKGDVVADFFCGSGTTMFTANELGRRWIGVDASDRAIDVVQERMGLVEDESWPW